MIFAISTLNFPKNHPLKIQEKSPRLVSTKVNDTYSPSFCAEKKVYDFENEMRNLEGIRCARCNQRMLSRRKYLMLLEKMSQVQNGHELEKLLTENKQYLSESNALILKDLKNINTKHPDADIKKVISKIHYHAPVFYAETCQNNINLIQLVTEKLFMSEDNRSVYLKTIEKLKKHKDFTPYNINEFSSIMNTTLRETDYPRKQKLYDKVMLHQTKAFKYYKNITGQSLLSQEPEKALISLGKALFKTSVSEISNISNREPDSEINKILICSDCAYKTANSSRYFKASDNSEALKNKFTQYLQDINKAAGNNELHADKTYIKNLVKFVRKTSNNNIVLNANDWSFLEYKKNFNDFPFENIEGIPCPKCGAIMLTHQQREKLFQKIQESSSIKELSDILKENQQNLPPITKKLAEKFRDNFIRDPYITDTLMKKKMSNFVNKLATHELRMYIKNLQKKSKDSSINETDRIKLEKIITNLQEYDKRKKLFFNSTQLKNLVIQPPVADEGDCLQLRDKAEEFLMKIELLQGPVYHSKEMSESENYSWTKVFTERIFRKAVFTQDHLIARNSGGPDTNDNKIGLHRECNQLKGKKSLTTWVKDSPEIEDYLADYLRTINVKRQEQNIKDCDTYASDISEKIYYLCGGREKLRKEFGKKDNP